MKTEKEILEEVKNLNLEKFADLTPVFPPHIYEMFKRNGLTQAEVKVLEDAELKTRIIELLPDDEKAQERLAGALSAISNPEPEKNQAAIRIIAERDPQTLVHLMALTEMFKTPSEIAKELKDSNS